ncbi:MAG: JAB domain-containing protein [Firmicutes bacterium]|nr:JAB domain-containing protein [Bacillota bacterium]
MSYTIKEIPKLERPRERLKEVGVSNLSDKELLAIILKTGTKNKSVNDLSLDILKEYSIDELKDITINKLINIKGMGEVKAIELIASIELGKRIFLKKNNNKKRLVNAESIWEDSKYLFNGLKQEYFYCLYFNNKQELIERKLLFMGTINSSITHPREIFKEAYKLSASSIVCMHNHPSNDIRPSREDIRFTENLVEIGKIQGIPILDHIIVGDDVFFSFYDNNILNP